MHAESGEEGLFLDALGITAQPLAAVSHALSTASLAAAGLLPNQLQVVCKRPLYQLQLYVPHVSSSTVYWTAYKPILHAAGLLPNQLQAVCKRPPYQLRLYVPRVSSCTVYWTALKPLLHAAGLLPNQLDAVCKRPSYQVQLYVAHVSMSTACGAVELCECQLCVLPQSKVAAACQT